MGIRERFNNAVRKKGNQTYQGLGDILTREIGKSDDGPVEEETSETFQLNYERLQTEMRSLAQSVIDGNYSTRLMEQYESARGILNKLSSPFSDVEPITFEDGERGEITRTTDEIMYRKAVMTNLPDIQDFARKRVLPFMSEFEYETAMETIGTIRKYLGNAAWEENITTQVESTLLGLETFFNGKDVYGTEKFVENLEEVHDKLYDTFREENNPTTAVKMFYDLMNLSIDYSSELELDGNGLDGYVELAKEKFVEMGFEAHDTAKGLYIVNRESEETYDIPFSEAA